MANHVVRSGETLTSIARKYGSDWKTILDHPENAGFKKKRPNPNLIFPGDVLIIPDRSPAAEKNTAAPPSDDDFQSVEYSTDYRWEKGHLSKYLKAHYRDGTQKDIHLDSITQAQPNLWRAKQQALKVMDEYNVNLIHQAMPAVFFILGMATTITPVTDIPTGLRPRGTMLGRSGGRVIVQGENGARIALDEVKLKNLAMQKWITGGRNGLVKVVSKEKGALPNVGGYITQEKYIMSKTPAEMERLLGLPAGELKNGANVMRLNRLPNAAEFELRGYTNTPGGLPYNPGDAYPPGLGVPQWQISRGIQIPSTPVKFVQPGQGY